MSRKYAGLIALLVGSELLGMLLGHWFYGLFLKTVPPLALSNFNSGAAHMAFIWYGLGAGLALFVWAIVATLLAPLFRPSADSRSARPA
jgi:hypothetical protein